MFWKLAFTLAVVLLLAGRTSVLRHPLARLLLPRSWSARLLSAVPDRSAKGKPAKETERETESASDSKLSRRIYIALVILASVAIATWIVTRALIYKETPPLP